MMYSPHQTIGGPLHEKFPELHHYTNWSGLSGIWNSQTMWASRADCLNDTTEIKHFSDPFFAEVQKRIYKLLKESQNIGKEIKDFVAECRGPSIASRRAANRIKDVFSEYILGHNGGAGVISLPFIVSFCAHDASREYEVRNGLLSQWRGYGGIERYCIVFDTFELQKVISSEFTTRLYQGLIMDKVKYNVNDDQFLEENSELIKAICDIWIKREHESSGEMMKIISSFSAMASTLKHRAFEEEQEVRIIAHPFTTELVKLYSPTSLSDFRVFAKETYVREREDGERKGEKVHYLKIFDNTRDVRRLPIRRIVVGPSFRKNELKNKVCNLVGNSVEVTISDTPFIG